MAPGGGGEAMGGRRPLAGLWRLPRWLLWRRLAHAGRAWLYTLPPYAWTLGGTASRETAASLSDPWPGSGALGHEIVRGAFPLLGRTLLEPEPPFRPSGMDPAWIAALNGFSWLRHLRAAGGDGARRAARELVELWIERESRVTSPAWDPLVLGERIAAWLGNWEFFAASAEHDFRRRVLQSLARQGRHLNRALPADLAGAQLIAALKGLAFAGAALQEGRPWLERAARLVAIELPRQVLPDGGHVERSPSVQLAVLRDLIDLRAALHAGGAETPPALADAVEQMAPALRLLQHGDGALALFNGGAEEDPLLVDLVLSRASARSRPLLSAPQSGFQRLQAGRLVVLIDAGRPPAPGLDARAHAGTLSFEASVGRERLIVNCGAHPADRMWRQVQRATAAHSTLTLDDHNSSEVLPDGGFGRRPDAVTCRREEADGAVWLDMSHDGWRSRFGLVHHRRLFLDKGGEDLRGEERLVGEKPGRPFVVRFHLHPGVQASPAQGGDAVILRLPKGDGWRLRAKGAAIALEDSVYLGQAGEVRKSRQVVLSGETETGETLVQWAIQREKRGQR